MDSNMALAKSLCVKSAISASTINDRLIALHGQGSVDKNTPQTWKYYLNISGQYHNTDTMMTVTSLDTLEEINFTKENLVDHTATAQAYGDLSSRFYLSLVNKYPDQIQLIQGILNPVDIVAAIDAKDGSILGYPKALVEPQEQTLIRDLEGFIQRYLFRWNVQAFGLTDTLYNVSYHALLYLHILPKLLNLRTLRCKTNEVHSFHIRQYLASHGRLDRFLPYMTLKQALFFYRNINYLERNIGKVETFNLLVQKVLTDRQIPLAEYSIRHLNSFDENHYPQVRARRKPINDQYNVAEKSYVEVQELFDKEDKIVEGNYNYHLGKSKADTLKFKNSNSSVIQTKALESNMVDYNDAVPDPLDAILLRQWAYMSSHGLYNVAISFKDPKSSEFRNMTTKDSLIYFNYILLESLNIKVNTISPIYVEKFRLPTKPTLQRMLGAIDNRLVDAKKAAIAIWNRQPQILPKFSTKAFFDLCHLLHSESLLHWFTLANNHDMETRGALDGAISTLYGDVKTELDDTGIDIQTWLVNKNLPVYNYTYNQAQELMANIFNASTGLVVDETKILKNIQRNMLELLGSLSSYTVQFIREINDSKIRPVNWAAIRQSKGPVDATSNIWLECNISAIGQNSSVVNDGSVDLGGIGLCKSKYDLESQIDIDVALHTTSSIDWGFDAAYPMSPFYLHVTYDNYDPVLSSREDFIGVELFNALTDEQKNSIKSFYS